MDKCGEEYVKWFNSVPITECDKVTPRKIWQSAWNASHDRCIELCQQEVDFWNERDSMYFANACNSCKEKIEEDK